MKIPLSKNKDFLAGLMFIAVGGGAMFMSREYPFGSALRMGPGYFPSVLGGLVMLGGIVVLIEGLIKQTPITRTWSVRGLIILPVAALVFGWLMENAGFVPAIFVLTSLAFVFNALMERPTEALFGFGILLLGVPAYLYWKRTAVPMD